MRCDIRLGRAIKRGPTNLLKQKRIERDVRPFKTKEKEKKEK